jgi:hypothetical protein
MPFLGILNWALGRLFAKNAAVDCESFIAFVPLVQSAFHHELSLFFDWYNQDRAHTTLKGATRNEVYFKRRLANRNPRFEPRGAYPRGSPCAKPQTLVKGQPGVVLDLEVTFVSGRRHLPRVTLRRAA